MNTLERSPLVLRLEALGATELRGRIAELPERVGSWLSYTPQTFPHFTRHTADHSQEIVAQLGKLLFEDGSVERPVVPLSAMECYLLVVSAYLHDAGMVSSDWEKEQILGSADWAVWVSERGPGHQRWNEIAAIRRSETIADDSVRHFIADRQTRFLLSDYIRRSHHERAGELLASGSGVVEPFTLGDPTVVRALSAICTGHGLVPSQLEDVERYPHRADVGGEQVNVRFLTHALRIGDLLDMGHQRACPFLLNAAAPLPADSLAHWAQYRRVVSRLTSPDRIEVLAECETQGEHQLLHDWCRWLVQEVESARIAMLRSPRHGNWMPPEASIDAPQASIVIRPGPSARYIPTKWAFQFDIDAVLTRLTRDVYGHPHAWLRELVQNALDAQRCRLADLLEGEALRTPWTAPASLRESMMLNVRFAYEPVTNPLSQESEVRLAITVEDNGIGMDAEVIERYFLQVGRSYYRTPEFRRRYGFVPISKFGIGFLSVFAASEDVTVETKQEGRDAIRLHLTGPRTYFMTESGERAERGTAVTVRLRQSAPIDEFVRALKSWCRMVEFPIAILTPEGREVIREETREQFDTSAPCVLKDGTSGELVVRGFDLGDHPSVRGHLYVFARVIDGIEDWTVHNWARYRYSVEMPFAVIPPMPADVTCFNGISVQGANRGGDGNHAARLDIRAEWDGGLDRSARHARLDSEHYGVVRRRWEEIVGEHLASSPLTEGPKGWLYMQKLADAFPFLDEYWLDIPEAVASFRDGISLRTSARDLASVPDIVYVQRRRRAALTQMRGAGENVVTSEHVNALSASNLRHIFGSRRISSLSGGDGAFVAIWSADAPQDLRPLQLTSSHRCHLVTHWELDAAVLGVKVFRVRDAVYADIGLNAHHPLVKWVVDTYALGHDLEGVTRTVEQLVSLMVQAIRYPSGRYVEDFLRYVRRWPAEIGGMLAGPPPSASWEPGWGDMLRVESD